MRLHRGSSKDARGNPPPTGILPLSASPPEVEVEVEVVRGGRSRVIRLRIDRGTTVRSVVRRAGEAPEGSLVLRGETPLPLDTPVEQSLRLTVVPTFSGG
jgi:sulfur carrier protein ThiS